MNLLYEVFRYSVWGIVIIMAVFLIYQYGVQTTKLKYHNKFGCSDYVDRLIVSNGDNLVVLKGCKKTSGVEDYLCREVEYFG